jgi:glycosyltransferase involved in cell wall biosynthesis
MSYTVVITSFNSAETIELVIKSIKALVPPPNQVILIDDASQDGSSQLIRDLVAESPEFSLCINDRNEGQSFSRNLGVRLSTNEFIIFQDDDDLSLPGRALLHIEALNGGADFSYVSSKKLYPNGYGVVYQNSEVVSTKSSNSSFVRHLAAGLRLPNSLIVFSPSSTLAVRKTFFESIGGFSPNLRRLEDIELACRALMAGARLAWSSRVGVERLHTLGNDKSPRANSIGELQVLKSAREFLNRREYFVARRMISLREAYFQRELLSLLFNLLFMPVVLVLSPSKFSSLARRVKHDLRQYR